MWQDPVDWSNFKVRVDFSGCRTVYPAWGSFIGPLPSLFRARQRTGESREFLGIGAKVPVAKCSNTCRRKDRRARVLALSEGLGVRSGRDVVKDDGIVGVAPYFVAVLAADLAIPQLARVHEPYADSSARFKWAVREPVTGQREFDDAVVECPVFGGEPIQVGDLVDVHRLEEPQVGPLHLELVADQDPPRGALPDNVLGVARDDARDAVGILVGEMVGARGEVAGDDFVAGNGCGRHAGLRISVGELGFDR